MKSEKSNPPSQDDWQKLPLDMHLYIVLRLFIAVQLSHLAQITVNFLSRIDLWLFPPLAFISTYFATTNHFPSHPIKIYVVLSCAFMFATLTLFLIRPKRRKLQVHWVKDA